jgi:heptosyltransferase I
MPSSYQSILVLRLSAMGDVILVLPLLTRLATNPQIKVTFVVSHTFYPLCAHLAKDIEIIAINKPKTWRDYLYLYSLFKKRHFDILLACQASFRIHLLYPLISAKRKIGFDAKRAKDLHQLFIDESIPFQPNHLADSFQQFADYIHAPPTPVFWNYPPLPVLQNHLQQKMDTKITWIALTPCASKQERSPRTSFWIELITKIFKETPYGVVLTGSHTAIEKKYAEEISLAFSHEKTRLLNWVGGTTLDELRATLSLAKCLIAPDTGTLHLANAIKTPVIGLYAVANPALSGPYYYSAYVINRYPEAIQQFLQKDPQSIPWGVRVHHPFAMSLISADATFQRLIEVIKKEDVTN